jgi:hypothetical protein
MSLTSYLAAPPRGGFGIVLRDTVVFLIRFGGELLSHVLRRSTIAAAALNFRDRDGIGCFARAIATKPEKKHDQWGFLVPAIFVQVYFAFGSAFCDQFGFYWIKSSLSSH